MRSPMRPDGRRADKARARNTRDASPPCRRSSCSTSSLGAGGGVSSNGSPSSLLFRLVLRLREGFSGESILEERRKKMMNYPNERINVRKNKWRNK